MTDHHNIQYTTSASNYVNGYNNLLQQITDSTKPKSYLNYLVFDEEMQLVESQSGALQIGTADAWHVLETANEIELNQGGYLAVYISNASMDLNTYFDNIHINYYKGRLQEENHYYPYGLCLRMSQASGITPNNYLYQTKELTGMVGNDALNLYDFGARQYDPILGRFTGIDPMGQFASGYVGMGNNPVSLMDPTGMYVSEHLELAFLKQELYFQNKAIANAIAQDWSNSGGGEELAAMVACMENFVSTMDKMLADEEAEAARQEGRSFIQGARGKLRTLESKIQKKLAKDGIDADLSGMTYDELLKLDEKMSDGYTVTTFINGEYSGKEDFDKDGNKVIKQSIGVFFDGMDLIYSSLNPILEAIAHGSGLKNYSLFKSPYKVIESKDEATQMAFQQIKNFHDANPNGDIILYGYSYGGVLVTHLANRLYEVGINVSYMATVDAANGPWSEDLDHKVPENVEWNDNFYQTTPSVISSRGYPKIGMNVHNYLVTGSNHHTIDEITSKWIILRMRSFLNYK